MLPIDLQNLVTRFRDNIENYKQSSYNETSLRREFLDKFIKILGWDVDNEEGLHDSFKEVIHEAKIRINDSTKAPDYCIQMAGKKLFYIEAKRPAVKIIDNIEAAFQVRRYGWTAQMPVCLLTDFEEFSVYNTGIKPKNTDKPSVARFFYCRYDELDKKNSQYGEFESNWHYLESLFHKKAVMRGSLERIKDRDKRGTQEVDEEFLKEIEDWRELLTYNIVLRNDISERELNFAVQKIIDRIIFLRICEDRSIESKNTLQNIAKNNDIYSALQHLFLTADDKYNSGLFHFHKEQGYEDTLDTLTLKLKIDDKPLRTIIKSLYDPAPYVFSVMPADILGSIYERFLGKVIRLTSAHKAKIEEKPEVRKAGGVYYTPQYIVNYIVSNTIGKQLAGRTPKTLKGFRVLDPACGSGSFLINAYQFLLDWYLREYLKNVDLHCKQKILVKTETDSFKLSIRERKRILTEHIFGVDIDIQAVEVTKLSLLLKALEGLHEQEIQSQLFHERILPNLGNNIKCGNSLIGTDFYAQGTLDFSEEEQIKINCFDWEEEFSAVFKDGGFDVVIGNPPYTYLIPDVVQDYFQKIYKCQNYQKDLYLIFLEKYSVLLKNAGVFGVIVSNTWLLSLTYTKIRMYMTHNYSWQKILHLPEKVFDAVVDTHVLIFEKITPKDTDNCVVEICKDKIVSPFHTLSFSDIPKDGSPINITVNPKKRPIFECIVKECNKLKDYCNVYNGVKPFEKGKGTPPQSEKTMKEKPYVFEGKKPNSEWSPLLRGSLIHRYVNKWNNDYWIKYGKWLAAPRDPTIFAAPEKLVIRQTGDSLIATYIENGIICRDNLHIVINNSRFNLLFLLAIINSKLLNFVYEIINPEKGEALAQVKKSHVEQLPIPNLDFSKKSDKDKHDKLVSYVEQMLAMKIKEQAENLPPARAIILRKISGLEKQINSLVYELYGLGEEDVRVVEGG